MYRLKYAVKRLFDMDYKGIFEVVKTAHQETGKNKLLLLIDIVYCGFRYNAGYTEYKLFGFYNLNREQRGSYLTRGKNNLLVANLNSKAGWDKLEDKLYFASIMKQYMGRQIIDLRDMGKGAFAQFVKANKRFVVKPLDGTCGQGVRVITNFQGDTDALYTTFIRNNQVVLEQYIYQHRKIANIYPRSVNTIRLVTLLTKEQVHVVFSAIRIGNGGKSVDNINSGGMSAKVDTKTGKITSAAADKTGEIFRLHPETNQPITGVTLPYFAESLNLVKSAASNLPDIRYIGWDIAVTETGPVLVEANHFPGNDIYQLKAFIGQDKKGILPVFQNILQGEIPQL